MVKWNHKVSFTHSRHEWCNLTNFYCALFFINVAIRECNFAMGTILGKDFPQALVHTVIAWVPKAQVLWNVCTYACGKPFPKIVPMAKLDNAQLYNCMTALLERRFPRIKWMSSVYTSKHLNLAKTQLGSTILHMTQFGPISAIELPKKELKRCIIESTSAALPGLYKY